MAKPPFNLGAQPAQRNPGSDKQAQRTSMNPAKTAKTAQAEGKTLTEAAVEDQSPDGDVGSMTPEEGDGQRPVYPTANPWPAAKAVAHKPFKV